MSAFLSRFRHLICLLGLASTVWATNPTLGEYCEKHGGDDKCKTCDECTKDGPANGSLVYRITFGFTSFEPNLAYGRILLHQMTPSPTIFTTQAFVYESLLSLKLLEFQVEGSVIDLTPPTGGGPAQYAYIVSGRRVALLNEMGLKTEFYAAGNSSEALPVYSTAALVGTVDFVQSDGSLWAGGASHTASTPTAAANFAQANRPSYLRLNKPDGTSVLFNTSVGSSSLVCVKSLSGRTIYPNSIPAKRAVIQRYVDGALRQLNSPQGLADFIQVSAQVAEVRFYVPEAVAGQSGSLYTLASGASPYRVLRVENASTDSSRYDQVKITEQWGTRSDVSIFNYNSALSEWTLARGSGADARVEAKVSQTGPEANQLTVKQTLRDGAGNLVSTVKEVREKFSWGFGIVNRIVEPDTLNLSTLCTYNGVGERSSQQNPDGSWEKRAFITGGRVSKRITPWKDTAFADAATGARVETTYSYIPVDSADSVAIWDGRARTETETDIPATGGSPIITKRTWYVYKTDSAGVYTEIEEAAATATATFGASGNPRTTSVYYTTKSTATGYSAVAAGRLNYVDHPDGQRAIYSYSEDLSNDAASFTTTETLATFGSPTGIDGLSTRKEQIYDVRGHLVEIRSYIRSGEQWYLVSTETRTINNQGFHIATYVNGRQTYAASYNGKLLASRTDEEGIATAYTYDTLGKVESITRAGVATSGSYAAQSSVLTHYARAIGGLDCGCDREVITQTSADSLVLEATTRKDATGRLTYKKDSAGLETTYAYSLGGRQTTRTNPDFGTEISLDYCDGHPRSKTGTAVVAEYYDHGVNTDGTTWDKVSKVSESGERWKKTSTNHLGQTIKVEEPAYDGGVLATTYLYNEKGQLLRKRQRHVAGATETTLIADTLFEYDALGNLARTGLDVNANGVLDLASADRITDQINTFASYDSAWWQVRQTKTYPTLDSATAAQVTETRRRLSGFTGTLAAETVTLDIDNNLTRQTDNLDFAAKLATATTAYPDSTLAAVSVKRNGLLVSETSKTISTPILYGYDALGRRISVKEPRHTQAGTYAYSEATGQLVSRTDAAGNGTTYTYYPQGVNGAGRTKTVADAIGQARRFAYDLQGRIIYEWGAANYPQAYAYASTGELDSLKTWRNISTTNLDSASWPGLADGDSTTWTYQASTGLMTRKQYADGKGTDYTYDKRNRLSTRTWARTVSGSPLVTSYGYVPATGELASIDYSDLTPDVGATYSRFGQLSTLSDGTGTHAFTYDEPKLRLQTETLPAYFGGRVLTRGYEGAGLGQVPGRQGGYQLGSSGDPDQDFAVSYGYDTSGRLSEVVSPAGSYAYGYVANGNRIATLTSPVHVATTAYEANRDVVDYVENKVGSTTVSKYDYTVNSLGQRSAREQSGTAFAQTSTETYLYNAKGEVNNSTTLVLMSRNRAYIYDQIGNRTASYSYGQDGTQYNSNSVNQYTQLFMGSSSTPFSPTCDFDGNQTTSGFGQAYVWDGENRLISVEPVIPAAGDKKVVNAYDAFSRRVRRQVFTYTSGVWGLTADEKFIYDGWNVAETLLWDASASAFAVSKAFTWGLDLSVSLQGAGGVGGLLAIRDGSAVYHYAYDANGNVSELLNNSGGVAAHYEYTPFGDSLASSGAYTTANEYRFSTKPFDLVCGMYYYGFRYYSPNTGGWLNRDPIGEVGGINLLAMTGNDPVDWVDILGLAMTTEFPLPGGPISGGGVTIDADGKMAPWVAPRITNPLVRDALEYHERIHMEQNKKKKNYDECMKGAKPGQFVGENDTQQRYKDEEEAHRKTADYIDEKLKDPNLSKEDRLALENERNNQRGRAEALKERIK